MLSQKCKRANCELFQLFFLSTRGKQGRQRLLLLLILIRMKQESGVTQNDQEGSKMNRPPLPHLVLLMFLGVPHVSASKHLFPLNFKETPSASAAETALCGLFNFIIEQLAGANCSWPPRWGVIAKCLSSWWRAYSPQSRASTVSFLRRRHAQRHRHWGTSGSPGMRL